MLAYTKTSSDKDKSRRDFLCAHCGAFITQSAALIKMNGATEHSYVNPSGIRCNFRTFIHCENVLIHEQLYEEYSWFPGYGWRFLMCGHCSLHLGWKYDALRGGMNPPGLFGVLIESVREVSREGEQ